MYGVAGATGNRPPYADWHVFSQKGLTLHVNAPLLLVPREDYSPRSPKDKRNMVPAATAITKINIKCKPELTPVPARLHKSVPARVFAHRQYSYRSAASCCGYAIDRALETGISAETPAPTAGLDGTANGAPAV